MAGLDLNFPCSPIPQATTMSRLGPAHLPASPQRTFAAGPSRHLSSTMPYYSPQRTLPPQQHYQSRPLQHSLGGGDSRTAVSFSSQHHGPSVPLPTLYPSGHTAGIVPPTSGSQRTMEQVVESVDRLVKTKSPYSRSLTGQLNFDISYQASASGLTDMDYSTSSGLGLPALPELRVKQSYHIPSELQQQLNYMHCTKLIGYLDEIDYCYLAIDSTLYLWRPNSADIITFESLQQAILTVAIVKPCEGIFQPSVKYILVVSTTIEVSVVGLLLPPTGLLLSDVLLQCSTDNVPMQICVTTPLGRVFFGGKDGNIYELNYKPTGGWFVSSPCRLLNCSTNWLASIMGATFISKPDPICELRHDAQRHQLVARTEGHAVQLYDLGAKGFAACRYVTSVKASALASVASGLLRAIDVSSFNTLVSLCVLSDEDLLSVVALTQGGVRYYLATSHSAAARPDRLHLVHIRLPPGFAPSTLSRPSGVTIGAVVPAGFLFISKDTESVDKLWFCSTANVPASLQRGEVYTQEVMFTGHVQHLCALSHSDDSALSGGRFLAISHYEVHILEVATPSLQLSHLLTACHNPDSADLKRFLDLQTPLRFELLCLGLLTIPGLEPDMRSRAMNTFVHYGASFRGSTDASFAHGTELPHTSFVGGSRDFPPNVTFAGSQLNQSYPNGTSAVASGQTLRGEALSTFIAEVLRPFWLSKLTRKVSEKSVVSAFSPSVVSRLLARLQLLRDLLTQLSSATLPLHSDQPAASGGFTALRRAEADQLTVLSRFVDLATQIVGLWKLLSEQQLQHVHAAIGHFQAGFEQLTLRSFVISEHEIVEVLMNALINSYSKEGLPVETLCNQLESLCPSIYSSKQRTYIDAQMLISRARDDPDNKQQLLSKALKLYKQICLHLELDVVAQHLLTVDYYPGVIDLCLHTAAAYDPRGLALLYYQNQTNDRDAQMAYQARKSCYGVITGALKQLLSALENGLPYARELFESALYLCSANDDFLFHMQLYEWLHAEKLTERLLSHSWPHLHEYLQHCVASCAPEETASYLELLAQYHTHNNESALAADVLEKLASDRVAKLSLQDRTKFLTSALMLARCDSSAASLAYTLEQKVEVAELQQRLYKALLEILKTTRVDGVKLKAEHALQLLDSQLYAVMQLYEFCADPVFNLPTLQLAILQCSGLTNAQTIRELWDRLFKKLLESVQGFPVPDQEMKIADGLLTDAASFVSSETFFPLDFISIQLEFLSIESQFRPTWALDVLLQLNVPQRRLWAVYDAHQRARLAFFASVSQPHHLMKVLLALADTCLSLGGLSDRLLGMMRETLERLKLELMKVINKSDVERSLMDELDRAIERI